MSLSGVLRPGFVQIRVLDMAEAIVHYRDRIGLDVVSTEADGRVYLRAFDEFDRHSIVLREADQPGMDLVAFKVQNEAALDSFAERIAKLGYEIRNVPAGDQPGVGPRISFTAPTGHRIDLFATMESSLTGPMTKNPDLWHKEPHGMKPQRFDHVLLYGDDLEGVEKIFVDALDFNVAERVLGPDGVPVALFVSCSNKPHDIAFVRYPGKDKLHHVSFYLESWNDIGHAADLMARYNVSVDIGPTRHGITRGQTIYFFDPSGNRNEVFAGGYTFYPDHPTRVWESDEIGKAIFYYEKALNERFMNVVT